MLIVLHAWRTLIQSAVRTNLKGSLSLRWVFKLARCADLRLLDTLAAEHAFHFDRRYRSAELALADFKRHDIAAGRTSVATPRRSADRCRNRRQPSRLDGPSGSFDLRSSNRSTSKDRTSLVLVTLTRSCGCRSRVRGGDDRPTDARPAVACHVII